MKVLAIISTIFIPLSFVTGVFGMNFVDMPWLDWIGWYYVTIGAMFFIWLFQLYVFKRKRRF
jgi:magnesium transporter